MTVFSPDIDALFARVFSPSRASAGQSQAAPHNGTQTSAEAAWSIEGVSGRLRLRVFDFIITRGVLGATCDEVEGALTMRHQTCSARINELMKSRHILDSGQRRLTSSNRHAVVWVRNGATVNS